MKKNKKFVPLRYDVVFKSFFGKEDNKDLLVALLNHYLKLDINDKRDIELINTELAPNNAYDKMPRLDLRVKTKESNIINVEIQILPQNYFLKRIYYYNSKMYVSQMTSGINYKGLHKTITLAFTMFDIFENDTYINHVALYHEEEKLRILDDISICVVELSKYKKLLDKHIINLDSWADLLCANNEEEVDYIGKRGALMAKAVRKLKYVTQQDIDNYWEDMYEKYENDMISYGAMNREEGIKEGIEKGIKEGIEKGIEKGVREEKKEIAKNMLKMGIEIEIISKSTGLSREEIKQLEGK